MSSPIKRQQLELFGEHLQTNHHRRHAHLSMSRQAWTLRCSSLSQCSGFADKERRRSRWSLNHADCLLLLLLLMPPLLLLLTGTCLMMTPSGSTCLCRHLRHAVLSARLLLLAVGCCCLWPVVPAASFSGSYFEVVLPKKHRLLLLLPLSCARRLFATQLVGMQTLCIEW